MNPDRLTEVEGVAREILKSLAITDAELVHKESGTTNYVFEVAGGRAPMVLRIGLKAKKQLAFARERCVIERVREAGIPVPEVLEQGEAGEWTYMAVLRMAGEPATNHPQRLGTLRDLARLAATCIHRVETIGYGPDFALEGQCGGGQVGWREWLYDRLGAVRRLELLRANGIISDDRFAGFRETLESVARWTDPPILNHGDLRLKNVLVDDSGAIVGLIDWEYCVSAAGPHWDLSVALHDLTIDQKEAFLEGYGLTAEAERQFAPAWRLFNALNYAPVVEKRIRKNDQAALERLRERFRGTLDLYVG